MQNYTDFAPIPGMYAVYNHNGTLLGSFKTLGAATREANEYLGVTGNPATVITPVITPAVTASDARALVGVKPKVAAMHPDATSVFNKVADESLPHLFFRWQDERAYEDFKDYAKVMERWCVELGVTFEKGTKRPFGFIFAVNDGRRYQVICNSRCARIRRLVNA